MRNEPFREYLDSLYSESPRGYAELEAARWLLVARAGLSESDALEVICSIVALPPQKPLKMGKGK